MKKIALAVLLALLIMPLAAEGVTETASNNEIIVFAAASLTETMTEIGEMYSQSHNGVAVIFNFDSSGTLKTQIEEGAPCDLFISAAPRQMNQLEELGMIDTSTRVNLLENKVTLAVPEGNPAGIVSFDDLIERLKNGTVFLAIGNSDVPVGQYTSLIFDYYGIDESAISNCLTYGTNVKEVTTQVSENSVDCGIIYSTDAYSAGLEVVDEATPEMCGQIIYPAAVISSGSNTEGAASLLEYLMTDEALRVFGSVGFSPAF